MRVIAAAAALLTLGAGVPRRQDAKEPLKVSAVRFYQPASATTTIEGVMEIRLDSLFRGGAGATQYRVDVAVADTTGLQLQHSSWTRSLAGPAASGLTTVETFGFNAAPGRYQLRVRVVPAQGDSLERTLDVEAFRSRPAVSDLLLANRVRQPDTDSEPPQQGEIRRAGLMLRTGSPPRLLPSNATLSWYAELYPVAAVSGAQLQAEVVGANGQRVVASAPRTVSFPAGGGLTRGSLDLSGLPQGSYRLRLSVRMGDSDVVAEAPFAMGSVQSLAAAGAAEAGSAGSGEANDVFAAATEDQLDSLEAPLVYVARRPGDLGMYRSLTVDGKRRFLRQFWNTPSMRIQGTVDRQLFYRLVNYADEQFHESGIGQFAGWNTDRGRVFIRNGQWDERLNRAAAQPMPYDVWKYTRDRLKWYIFADRTGVGNYVLFATNDVRESGIAQSGWEGQMGQDATRAIYQFLGLTASGFGSPR